MTSPPQVNPLALVVAANVPPNRQQVNNASMALNSQRQNLLANGGFEQWHWGAGPISNTGSGSTASNVFGPDRFYVAGIGTDTLAVSRDSINQESGSYCAACTYTLGNGNGSWLDQYLYEATPYMRGATLTLTVRVKCSTTNAVRASLYGGGANWVNSAYHTGNGQYQTLSVTVIADPSSGYYLAAGVIFTANCTAYVDSMTLVVGTIPTDFVPQLAWPDALPNDRIGLDLARPNLLTNGGFELWQRGNGPFSNINAWAADRWQISGTAGDTISISKATSNTDVGSGSNACAVSTLTKGAGGNTALTQTFVPGDGYQIAGRYFSFSCRVRTSTPNACYIRINDGTTLHDSAYHSGSGGYETLTCTHQVSGSSTVVYLQIWFVATATVWVDNACVVDGVVPSYYSPPTPADDFARALRYYESSTSDQYLGMGSADSATGAAFIYNHIATKGYLPTLTFSAASTFTVRVPGGGGIAATAIADAGHGPDKTLLGVNVASGLVAGQAVALLRQAGGAIMVEWNP
jgi:hypothetical protein